MAKYLVRRNCEYSIEVEAETEEGANHAADLVPLESWGQAWAETETIRYLTPQEIVAQYPRSLKDDPEGRVIVKSLAEKEQGL